LGYINKGLFLLVRYGPGYFQQSTVTGFITAHSFEVSGVGGPYTYEFTLLQAIPEKSDIEVRVQVRTNNGRYTCAWDMIVIETGLS